MYEVFIIVSFVYILCMVRVYCSACLVEVYTVISVLQKCNLFTMHVCTDLLLSNFQQRYTCIFPSYRHNTHTVLVTSLHSCISMYFSNKIVAVPMHVATTLYCTCMHASCCPISSLHTCLCPCFSRGPSFITYLEELPTLTREDAGPFRMPISEKYKVHTCTYV